jgi:pyridoxine kinase
MRMGVEVWPVITVHFSNHTGYDSWYGPLLSASDLSSVVRGIDERGVLGQVDAVLSGYQGGEDIGAMILEAVALVKQRNPAAIYCCDPVLGDEDRGSYVREGIADFMRRHVVPAAQIITPNQFELKSLTGMPASTMDEVLNAADAARSLGPEVVLITSVVRRDGPPDTIEMLAVDAEGAWLVSTPRLARTFTGSGDVTAAIFLATLLRAWELPRTLAHTAAVIYGVLKITNNLGRKELALIAGQEELIHPSHAFKPVRVR